ncbi:hypothetical protein AS026_19820 [Rhizobium altiplani]|uniref:Uncharacterized protein n=1 Tax=Rhizobium altiplani TaxID=1864509 RepID=A0A109J6Z6_9HYPH|nr:hypothetical protein AS026_19820 [Rhizobium altiplani]
MEMKEVGDLAMNRDETLTLPRRFEAHHPPLLSPQREMRIFGAVVQPLWDRCSTPDINSAFVAA